MGFDANFTFSVYFRRLIKHVSSKCMTFVESDSILLMKRLSLLEISSWTMVSLLGFCHVSISTSGNNQNTVARIVTKQKSNMKSGHRFAFDAPKIWNDFPYTVCSATCIASFRKKFKTYLFAKAYLP